MDQPEAPSMTTRLQARVDAQDEKIQHLSAEMKGLSATVSSMKEVLFALPESIEKTMANLLKQHGKLPHLGFDGDISIHNDSSDSGQKIPSGGFDRFFRNSDQSKEQAMGMFLRDLRDEMENWVRGLNLTSCDQAREFAQHVPIATIHPSEKTNDSKASIHSDYNTLFTSAWKGSPQPSYPLQPNSNPKPTTHISPKAIKAQYPSNPHPVRCITKSDKQHLFLWDLKTEVINCLQFIGASDSIASHNQHLDSNYLSPAEISKNQPPISKQEDGVGDSSVNGGIQLGSVAKVPRPSITESIVGGCKSSSLDPNSASSFSRFPPLTGLAEGVKAQRFPLLGQSDSGRLSGPRKVDTFLLDWIERSISAPFLSPSPNRATYRFLFHLLSVPPLLSHSVNRNHNTCSWILVDWEDLNTTGQCFLGGQQFEQFDPKTQLTRAINQPGPTGQSLELKDRLRRMKGAADDAKKFQAKATLEDESDGEQTRQWLIPWKIGLIEEDDASPIDVNLLSLGLRTSLFFKTVVLIENMILWCTLPHLN